MEPTVENLSITAHQVAPPRAADKLSNMAEKLPFEQNRADKLNIDREQDARNLMTTEEDNTRFYLAEYPEQVVGGIVISEHQSRRGQTVVRIRGEWIQRNRDDIRERIYQTLAHDYPGAHCLLTYPAQNRTARRERDKFSFCETLSTRPIYFYKTALSDKRSIPNSNSTLSDADLLIPSEVLMASVEPVDSGLEETEKNSLESGSGKNIRFGGREISCDEDTRVRQVRWIQIPDGFPAADALTSLESQSRNDGYDYLEIVICGDESLITDVLNDAGYSLHNKRMGWIGVFES